MATTLRFGVIGCGVVHATHCEALEALDGAILGAVYDVDAARAAKAADVYGVMAATDLDDLWRHVDAVCVCVPSGLHAELGLRAAEAGKHVLVEKPIDVTYAAALRLVETCEARGVKLGTISQHRFAPDIRDLRDLAQSGGLGRLLAGDVYNKWYRSQAYYDSGDWRGTWRLDGGGCLMNQGVHYVDMIQWIMGGVRAVQAQVRTAAHERIEVEDAANALLEFRNGAIGVLQGSTCTYPAMSERLEVHGLYGSAVIEADRYKLLKVDPEGAQLGLYGDGVNRQPTPSVSVMELEPGRGTGASDPAAAFGPQHRMQVEDFVRSIHEGREPYVTGRAALEPLKVVLAVYESARAGGARVELA